MASSTTLLLGKILSSLALGKRPIVEESIV
jgi:hypothetical protein